MPVMPVTVAAFEAKIDRTGEHDLWIGSTDSGGTGQIRIDGKLRTAAQVSWELANGHLPAGHRVYSCPDVKPCIRADRSHRRRAPDAGQIDDAFGRMRSKGMSHSRMNNARAALSGACKWGRRHDKVRTNPMRGFELPKSKHVARKTIAPELDEVLRVLSGAGEHDPEIAPVLKLAATTGLRRGELCGLRRSHLRLDRGELSVERAISEIKSVVEDKPTKNNDTRTIKLDEATINFLHAHLALMDKRAESCGVTVAADGYLFSLEPDCAVPMRPDLMTKRTARLRKLLGITNADFSATILAMRKWTSTELMDAGFNYRIQPRRQLWAPRRSFSWAMACRPKCRAQPHGSVLKVLPTLTGRSWRFLMLLAHPDVRCWSPAIRPT